MPSGMVRREILRMLGALAPTVKRAASADSPGTTLYLVPNSHDVVAGWLSDFQTERNHSLNNYLDHLDRVRDDPNYKFAFSEIPNLLSMMEFAPDRVDELMRRIREGRVELANACFLEATASLSGGEALVQLEVQGLRWYEKVMKVRPRYAWMIDLVGAHSQLPQIVAGLGLDAVFFCRNVPAAKAAFWWAGPDGSRVLAVTNPATYIEFPKLFTTTEPLTDGELDEMARFIGRKRQQSPSRKIALSLAGSNDYSMAPKRKQYPAEFLEQWRKRFPDVQIKFSTPSDYVSALRREMRNGETQLETHEGGTPYAWNAFWVDLPSIKLQHRLSEHRLLAAEMLATAASLTAGFAYPSQAVEHAWIQLLMNTDRNVLWGSVAGEPLRSEKSWDATDRYAAIQEMTQRTSLQSLEASTAPGQDMVVFNPLNWRRHDPVELTVPVGRRPARTPAERDPEHPETVLCEPSLAPLGLTAISLELGPAELPKEMPLPEVISTEHFRARFDARSGALVSLKVNDSGKELLGGPANVIAAEDQFEKLKKRPQGETFGADFMAARPDRKRLAQSTDYPAQIRAFEGPVATTVRISQEFYGGSRLDQRIRLYRRHPRIDFDLRLDLRVRNILVTANFPMAVDVVERTRGIPYGFETRRPRHPFVPNPDYLSGDLLFLGYPEAILPAIRWESYLAPGIGCLAILDRGLPFREVHGNTVTLGLVNAVASYHRYPNPLLDGQGQHHMSYSLVPHGVCWQDAAIPRLAYEFNAPLPVRYAAAVPSEMTFAGTSPNVIVEALRRVCDDIEMRLYEWQGRLGHAEVRLNLPHLAAKRTNLLGEAGVPLHGDSTYRFPIRPQEIVTLRFQAGSTVPETEPLRSWEPLVPAHKREYLKFRITKRGHTGVFP